MRHVARGPSVVGGDATEARVTGTPIMVYVGEDLIALAVRVAYAQERERFRGAGRVKGIDYTFDVAEAPIVRLVPDEQADHDLVVDVGRLDVQASLGPVRVARTLALRATARLGFEGGAPRLTPVHVDVVSTRTLDRLIARLLDARVLPALRIALATLPLPPLTHPFAPDLRVEVTDLTLGDGPTLAAGARLQGGGDVAAADGASASDLAFLNRGVHDRAGLIVLVSGEAVGVLLSTLLPPSVNPSSTRSGGGDSTWACAAR